MARTPMVVPPASFAPTLQQARCAGSTILMRFTSGRARKCWSAIEHDYDQQAAEAQKFYDSGEIETAKSLLKRLLEVAPRESKLYFVWHWFAPCAGSKTLSNAKGKLRSRN